MKEEMYLVRLMSNVSVFSSGQIVWEKVMAEDEIAELHCRYLRKAAAVNLDVSPQVGEDGQLWEIVEYSLSPQPEEGEWVGEWWGIEQRPIDESEQERRII